MTLILRPRRPDDEDPVRAAQATLDAEVDGRIVGRTSIRHELNDWLRARGGHIGYAVLSDARRRGYAGAILAQSRVIARSHGVRELNGTPIRRYWISVA